MMDGGYLENIMSKHHKMMFDDTLVITTNKELMKDGRIEYVDPGIVYDGNNVKTIRLDISKYRLFKNTSALDGLFLFQKIYDFLKIEKPDFIIAGGVGSLGNFPIARYVRKINPKCVVVCRSHATIENVDRKSHKIRRRIWNSIISLQNMYMIRYYKRIYGILPNAIDYMVQNFGIPKEKTALLPLGYDDFLIHFDRRDSIREQVRKIYGISENSYLVVHGGKLSPGKKTLEFIQSIKELPENFSAVIFGDFGAHIYGENVSNSYELKVREEAEKDGLHKIVFTGALSQEEIYNLYLAADVAVFPGAPSCLRQEAVGAGLPIVMYVNPGDEGINININNNAYYLEGSWSVDELSKAIIQICSDNTYGIRARELANNEYKKYSYSNISFNIISDNL